MFRLEVQFSGVCLYVLDSPDATKQTAERVGVVIYDCRARDGVSLTHLDNSEAEPHVGYVRVDLGDWVAGFPPGDGGGAYSGPRYELVHRFSGESIRFQFSDGNDGRVGITRLKQPDFDRFAPSLNLRTDLFTPGTQDIVMSAVLTGGEFISNDGNHWKFLEDLNPGQPQYKDSFANSVTWRRVSTSQENRLTITIGDLTDALHLDDIPEGATIRVKVANHCQFNPLEWNELKFREGVTIDDDFKWLYRLFQPFAVPPVLPAPIWDPQPSETADEACMGGVKTGSVPA